MHRSLSMTRIAALVLSLVAPFSSAHAWEPEPARRSHMTQLAQRFGLTQASQPTVERLNQRFGCRLKTENVYYTTASNFARLAGQLQNVALGACYVDHGEGPHAMIVCGDRIRDSIDPGFPTTFRENGQKTREQGLAQGHGSARVFALWKAPTASLTKVGINTEAAVRNHAQSGLNCVAMANGNLWSEGNLPQRNEASPFANLRSQGWPHEGAEAVFGANPDVVIQVVDDRSFNAIRANHDAHLIKPWNAAY